MSGALASLAARANRVVLRHWPRRFGRQRAGLLLHRLAERGGSRMSARASWGSRFNCDLRDLVQSRIYYFAVWEPNLTALLSHRLGPGDVFVDVGANIGYFSLLAARLVGPQGGVVAIDASPRIFALLDEHVRANGATNVRTVNAAVSDKEGTLSVYAGPANNSGMTSTVADRGGSFEAEVRAAPLHALLREDELRRVRFVKIDVEGAELPILLDILAHLHLYRRDVEIAVELSPESLVSAGIPAHELLARFEAQGFNWYVLDNDYSLPSYFDSRPRPALRGRSVPTEQVDIVLSRFDGETLGG